MRWKRGQQQRGLEEEAAVEKQREVVAVEDGKRLWQQYS
jgi:hypothetical protein